MRLIRVFVIIFAFFTLLPRVVHAEEAGLVYFYEIDEYGRFHDVVEEVIFEEDYTVTDKAFVVLKALTENTSLKDTCVPEGTELLDCGFAGGQLVINFSKEAFSCGGNSHQQLFVEQIINTVYSIDEISCIMLLIDGDETTLPEGVDLTYYNRL